MDIKPDNKFKQNLLLVVIGVLLISALMNFSEVLGVLNLIIGLFMPLLVGGAIAFVINVPMSFFERQIDRLSQKTGASVIEKDKDSCLYNHNFRYICNNVIFYRKCNISECYGIHKKYSNNCAEILPGMDSSA